MSAAADEIEAIRQLKARYFRLLDTKQWHALQDLFTADLAIAVDQERARPGQVPARTELAQGAAGFVAQLRDMLADRTTVHHGHMPEIALTGPDSATGVWAMEDIVDLADGTTLHGFGHYHEDYRREAGAWRIARLHLTRLRVDIRPA